MVALIGDIQTFELCPSDSEFESECYRAYEGHKDITVQFAHTIALIDDYYIKNALPVGKANIEELHKTALQEIIQQYGRT